MQRANYPPDLDLPDSPLLSASIPSGLGPIPGSALAERIFNDPDAWETEDFDDESQADPMAWFADELERFRLNSAASSNTAFSSEVDDEDSSDAELDKITFMPSPGVPVQTSLVKGIKRKSVRPISLAALFKHSDDLPKDMQAQLAHILESGGLPLTVGMGPPSASTPASSMRTGASSATLPSAATESSQASPVAVHSASATLSFLEWYGIYPDSPLRDINFRKSIYANSRKAKTPHLHIPSPKAALTRPPSLLSPSVLMPDLQVVPPKRGSSVPPLESLKPMLDKVLVQATKASPPAETRSSSLPNPPGLSQSPPPPRVETPKPSEESKAPSDEATNSNVDAQTPASTPPRARQDPAEGSRRHPSGIRSPNSPPPNEAAKAPLDQPTTNADSQTPASTPPRGRQNSAEGPRRRPADIRTTDSPPPYTRVDSVANPRPLPSSTVTVTPCGERPTPTSTPVRRLPSIPPSLYSGRSTTPSTPQPSTAVPTASTSVFSPLPSSLPTTSSLLSPEPPLTSQTITFHGRPMSAVRSPLGGPAGPRSRASHGGRPNVLSGPRVSSGLARRPPVLQL